MRDAGHDDRRGYESVYVTSGGRVSKCSPFPIAHTVSVITSFTRFFFPRKFLSGKITHGSTHEEEQASQADGWSTAQCGVSPVREANQLVDLPVFAPANLRKDVARR